MKWVKRIYWICMSAVFLLILYRQHQIDRLQCYEGEQWL